MRDDVSKPAVVGLEPEDLEAILARGYALYFQTEIGSMPTAMRQAVIEFLTRRNGRTPTDQKLIGDYVSAAISYSNRRRAGSPRAQHRSARKPSRETIVSFMEAEVARSKASTPGKQVSEAAEEAAGRFPNVATTAEFVSWFLDAHEQRQAAAARRARVDRERLKDVPF